jgi:hypothetical protein
VNPDRKEPSGSVRAFQVEGTVWSARVRSWGAYRMSGPSLVTRPHTKAGAVSLGVRGGEEGEREMMRNRSLLLGVGIGLLGVLAVLTARYVAVVLAG